MPTTSPYVSANDLVSGLIGTGISFSGATYTGSTNGAGRFNLEGVSNPGIQVESGIILSSGNITSIDGPNQSDSTSTDFSRSGDADLNNLVAPGITYDASVLQFNFTPNNDGFLSFNYVFASEEYNEYVGSQFNDVFGFFLTDSSGTKTNIALLPGYIDGDPEGFVAINNVNQGYGSYAARNGSYFQNNDISDFGLGSTPFNTEFDGFTTPLTAITAVNGGETYTLKLAIADTGDGIFDSAVFLQGNSLESGPLVASNDGFIVAPNQSVSLDILDNDLVLPDQTKQIKSFDLVSQKGGTISLFDNQTPTNKSDDKLIYTPKSGFVGTDSFDYVLADSSGNLNSGFVSVQVGNSSNLPVINLDIQTGTVSEDGTSNLVYTFTRIGSASSALTVNFDVAGTATFGKDYSQNGATSFTATTGQIVFAAGATTATLIINPIADNIIESDETIKLSLNPNSAYITSKTSPEIGIIANDDFIVGTSGNDNLVGTSGNDTIKGLGGNDIINGGAGDDLLIGVNPSVANPGQNEFDTLNGGTGKDTFVLGDSNNSFYQSSILGSYGTQDYAYIEDFNLAEGDQIQLNGSQEDYLLFGSYILQNNGYSAALDRNDDVIGYVQGTALSFEANSDSFVFV